jgi:hypothetical protein
MVIKNVGPCLLFWVHNFNDICLFHTLWLNVFGSTGSIGECKVIFANTYTYNIKISLKNKYENHWGVEIPRPNVNNWWNQTDQIRLGLIKPSPVSVWIHTPSLLNSYGFKNEGQFIVKVAQLGANWTYGVGAKHCWSLITNIFFSSI